MVLMDIIAYLKTLVPAVYYPSAFPIGSPSDCIAVAFEGGQVPRDTVAYSALRIAVRNKDMNKGYEIITDIMEQFNDTHDINIGDHRLIQARWASPYPSLMGIDENRWYIHTITLFVIID
jgi:hypothetical protein